MSTTIAALADQFPARETFPKEGFVAAVDKWKDAEIDGYGARIDKAKRKLLRLIREGKKKAPGRNLAEKIEQERKELAVRGQLSALRGGVFDYEDAVRKHAANLLEGTF